MGVRIRMPECTPQVRSVDTHDFIKPAYAFVHLRHQANYEILPHRRHRKLELSLVGHLPIQIPREPVDQVVVVDVHIRGPIDDVHPPKVGTVRILPGRNLNIVEFTNQPIDGMTEHCQHPTLPMCALE